MKSWPLFILILVTSCLPVDTGELIFKESRILPFEQDDEGDDDTPLPIDLSEEDATFKRVTELILKDKCLRCHREGRSRGGVNLSQYDAIFGWSDYFQPITTPNEPENSGIYTEVAKGSMPPKNPLSPEEIAYIKRWIEAGAPE